LRIITPSNYIMKKILFIFAFALLLASCKKEHEDNFLTSIKAGQTDGIGIKYMDFEPDKKFVFDINPYYATLNLDLNNDSINDFELRYYEFHSEINLQITPQGNNSVCISSTIHWDPPFAESLALEDSIGNKNNWSNSKAYLFMYSENCYTDYDTGKEICTKSGSGYWYNHDNIYLAVKIIKDDKEFYGWIDVKMKGEAICGYAITVS
jgi:hypothetical protein